MRFPRPLLPVLLVGGLAFSSSRAFAEEGDGPADDPRAKLKAQAEKILRLMRENEAALLEASTLGGAQPKGPDVPIPDTPPAPSPSSSQGSPQGSGGTNGGGSSGGSNGGSSGGSGARGEEIRRKLEELIKGQQQGAGRIPDELAQLVQMLPKQQGGGSGQQGGQPEPQPNGMTPEARAEQKRKQLEEQ